MFSSKKPYSAVTVAIDNLVDERYEEDDYSGIPDLVEAIKLQSTGPTEAARALRKKLKYGSVHRQLRALVILDGLIQNAGSRFQRAFIDEPLLERLRFLGTSDLSDPVVRKKCQVLYAGWAREYKNTPGLEKIAGLSKEMPRRKQALTQDKSKVLRETEQNPFEDDEEPAPQQSSSQGSPKPQSFPQLASSKFAASGLSSAYTKPAESKKSKKDKDKKGSKKKAKPFNLEEEKDQMKSAIAEASVASTNLLNALKLINREHQRVSDNGSAVDRFETCKKLRRQILRYIQLVEAEQWLGALLHANDELVTALMTFEQLDTSIDADSDSEDEAAEQAHLYRMATSKGKENADMSKDVASNLAGLSIGNDSSAARPMPPPRPIQAPVQVQDDDSVEEDDDDPFGDSNAVETPAVERGEPTWRVV